LSRPTDSGPRGVARFFRSPGLVYLGLAILFLYDVALTGRSYLLRDILTFFHPWQTAVRELVRSGQLPLWNHDTFCGVQLLANLQSGVFYPANWLHWFLPFDFSLTLGMVFHLAIAGALMRTFLVRVGVGGWGAFLGGALFAFSGWSLSYLEFPMKLGSAVWIPLMWIGLWEAMRDGRRHGVAKIAAAIALSLLAGYPQLTMLGLISTALFALFLIPEAVGTPGITRSQQFYRVAALPAALIVAGLAAAAQLLPSAEMAELSSKVTSYDATVAMSRSLPWKALPGLLDPFFLGFPGVDRYWGGELVEFCFGAIHIGGLGLLLAAAALPTMLVPRGRKRRHRGEVPEAAVVPVFVTRFLVAGFVVGLVLALGRHTPIYPLLHEFLPGFGRTRWPATAALLMVLHLAPLAGIGLTHVRRSHRRIRIVAIAAIAVGAILTGTALLARGPLADGFRTIQLAGSPAWQIPAYEAFRDEWITSRVLHGSFLLAAGALALLVGGIRSRVVIGWTVLAVLDLFLVARALEMPATRNFYDHVPAASRALAETLDGQRIYTPHSTDQLGNFLYGCRNPIAFSWAQRAMLCNANVPAGIPQAHGCEPLNPRRHEAFVQMFDDERTPHGIRERIFDLWDAARLLEVRDVRPIDVPGLEDPQAGLTLNPHRPRLGRATIVSGWRTLDDGPAVLEALFAPNHDPRQIALLEVPEGTPPPEQPESTPERATDSVEWENGPNSVRAAWLVGEGGMLRVLESWAPGWEARVNGRPVPVYRADFLFMAVPVPAGSVEVELIYRPRTVTVGLILSIVGLIVLVLLALPARSQSPRAPSDS